MHDVQELCIIGEQICSEMLLSAVRFVLKWHITRVDASRLSGLVCMPA